MSYREQQAFIEEMNYQGDRRVNAHPQEGFDENSMTITWVVEECGCAEHEALQSPFWSTQVNAYDPYWREARCGFKPGDWFVSLGSAPLEKRIYDGVTALSLTAVGNRVPCRDHLHADEVCTQLAKACGYSEDPDLTHVHVMPARFEVCPTCNGKGSHVNPSIDAGGISSDDEFWEDDRDEYTGESRYFRGDYDVTCNECQGNRVVGVVDENACDPQVLKLWQEAEYQRVCDEREDRHARMYGY